ncbi:DNA-directed RNA polymerase III subunit RPC3 [Nymphon striatum]|nr:DNA-directed RNA polymerase III subunit RPC3 [Nymphon striatum]
MSKTERLLCLSLLNDIYGEVTGQIVDYLMKYGSQPLAAIVHHTKIPRSKINKALLVLIRCSMIEFKIEEKQSKVEYGVLMENILLIAKYPRYINCISSLYGDIAQIITEELLENGQLTTEEILITVQERINRDETFQNLINAHFIQRCPIKLNDTEVSSKSVPLFMEGEPSYEVPKVNLDVIEEKYRLLHTSVDEPPAKKIKIDIPIKQEKFDPDDSNILWKFNFDRFHECFRDELIVQAVTNRIDARAGTVIHALLKISELEKFTELDKYLMVLVEEDSCGLMKHGDSGGGTYYMNYKKVIYNLLTVTMHSIVKERFSDKGGRIFQLILMKKYLEQKQIEKYAMINKKDAKNLIFHLFHENFLEILELPQTADHNPINTYFLYYIDFVQLTRSMLEQVYKSMYNAIVRQKMVLKQNERLLAKKNKVDAMVAAIQGTGDEQFQSQDFDVNSQPGIELVRGKCRLHELARYDTRCHQLRPGSPILLRAVEESVTSTERFHISKIHEVTLKIDKAVMQLDKNAFIFKLASRYQAFK